MLFERLAFDANAAIDSLRPGRPFPAPLRQARSLYMPLFVLAELHLGVARSRRQEENAASVNEIVAKCVVLPPDEETIGSYIIVRNSIEHVRSIPTVIEKREGFGHDLWIAALCLQHDLPLLTNDAIFDQIGGLHVVHW